MAKSFWWSDFTSRDFDDLDPDAVVAVLPIAATEQHGPHLPVATDHAIMAGMLETVFPLMPAGIDMRVLPIQAVGKSNEHIRSPGTLTISATTLIDHWCDLGASVARAGVRKLVIVNSHGGNEEVMGIVARELRVRHDMMVAKTSWMRFGLPDGLYGDYERQYGIHGGDVETSLMLHFTPETVRMDKAEDFTSRVAAAQQHFTHIAHTGPNAFAWIAQDVNPSGAIGEAAQATPDKGRLTAEHQANGFVELIGDMAKARLADWITTKG